MSPALGPGPYDTALQAFYHQRPVLVTGATGFTGVHCCAALQAYGATVATAQHHPTPPLASSPPPWVGDLCALPFVSTMLHSVTPATLLHLAAVTPARPGASATRMMQANVLGTVHLLEALRAECPEALTVLTSSGAVYGTASSGAVDETAPLAPHTVYGASKAAQEMVALAMGTQYGVRVVRARTFNLVGPGEPAGLVCSAIARQIAAAECGAGPPRVEIGRLDTQRDFLDIRDAVAAYLLLGMHGQPGEAYNVCSGRVVPISDILERLLGMAQVPLTVTRHSLPVGSPVQAQWGSNDKLQRATGWQPRIPLAQSLADVLTWWRHAMTRQGQL